MTQAGAGILSDAPVNHGRDAHWLEPFAYGALCFGAVFAPRDQDAAVYVVLLGAFVGVVAAGISHFTPDRFKFRLIPWSLLALSGALPGLIAGWLLREFAPWFWLGSLRLGVCAGVVTFVVTLLRGRQLADRERARKATAEASDTTFATRPGV